MRQKLIPESPRAAAPFRAALSLIAIVGCAALTGCSSVSLPSMPPLPWSNPSIKENASAETLYNEGVQMLSNKKYVPAIERFQKLRSDYPFAPELVAAEIKLGEAYYLNKQYTEAVETLKEFEAMHPNNENIPYALYLAGMAHFDQFSSIDRDQKTTEIAKGFFERLINNYPQSPYAAKAQDKLAKCLEYLAEHEFDIASYYMREKKYPAARDRFEGILRRYRNTSVAPKALYQLGESYRQEKNNVKAALAFEALTEHYPNDPLAKNARAQLTQLAQEKQDPLSVLLKPEPRPAAALAQNKTEADAKAKDAPRIAKTEVMDEQPGDEKGFFGRMVDKINPFSSTSPAPAKQAEKKDAPAKTTTASAKSAQLIGTIDESLNRKSGAGAAVKSAGDPTPPSADLPQISEAAMQQIPSETATLSAIDGKLENKSKVAAALPPPPEAAAILKTPIDEKAVAKSQASKTLADANTLLSSIDGKLKGKGLDAAPSEEPKIELPQGQKPVVTPRPKAAPEKVLEPRLTTEQGPLYLPPEETANREKSPETAAAPAPSSAPASTLPTLAIKGPQQPEKDKPAETKVAAKAKSPGEEEDPENKGIFDQLKEDLSRVQKLLNPFSW